MNHIQVISAIMGLIVGAIIGNISWRRSIEKYDHGSGCFLTLFGILGGVGLGLGVGTLLSIPLGV